jgi:hypothetical protein
VTTSIQEQAYMRLQDRMEGPAGTGRLSFDRLIESWRPTDPEPQVLSTVSVTSSGSALSLECFGAGLIVPAGSQSAPITTIFTATPASADGMAFFAEVDFGHMISRFQGNVNLGLLVLAGFHDFKDASERSNFFSREFYYSAGASTREPLPPSPGTNPKTGSRRLDTSALIGRWQNTNGASVGVPRIDIRDNGEHLALRAFGAGESGIVDWGEVAGRAYGLDFQSDEAMAFSAVFASDLSANSGIRCHFQANIKQGVLVVAYFTEFNDRSGRSNYFAREFYYKTSQG